MTFKLKNVSLALAAVAAAFGASACTVSTYSPATYQECGYDYWGYYYCDTYYYNGDGTTDTSRDLITDIAQAEEELLNIQAKHYADKFKLGLDQGMKIAKTIADFNVVKNRSESDVADFAQRLYGVSPSKIVAAVGAAQAGDNSQLEDVVAEGAANFKTTPANMKSIVKTLHGKLLQEQGIRF